MNNFLEGHFYNPSRGNLKINQVIDGIFDYMIEKPEKFYDIIIGCDSSSGEEPHFPVAVVILRVGEGGRFFLKKIGYKNRKFYNWKTRVLEEVLRCYCGMRFFFWRRTTLPGCSGYFKSRRRREVFP